MRPLSHQLLIITPAVFSLLLCLLAAVPMQAGTLSLAPNIAWLMTLTVIGQYPPAWPRSFAFFIGLLQDVLFHTPLGSQALLTLMLTLAFEQQARFGQPLLFRLRWLEAAGILIIWHGLLWTCLALTQPIAPDFRAALRLGLVNTLWYPFFYLLTRRFFHALPEAN